jgi:sugar phosphate isomerase/epimerase
MTELKFGVLTNPTVDILKEINTIAKLGFDFVEIGIEWPEGAPEVLLKKKRQILNLLKKYKLFAIGHTAWWIDFSTPYSAVRKGWIAESKKKIRIAKELGIKKICFHSHSRAISKFYRNYKKLLLDNFVLSLKELVKYGKKLGIMVMLENATEKGEITEFKDFKYIVDRVPGLKVHLDVGHAFMHDKMKNIKKCIETFGKKIEHIHLHDNHGKEDEHLPIGKGNINFKKIIKMLKAIGYNKTITFEVFSKNRKDVVRSREKIKKLWQKY